MVIDGFSVDTVENGFEAIGLIKSHHYDFIFTDLKMPEMDGVEVAKSVRQARPDIDVVIITGYGTIETAVECMKYGAMDYLQKPFTEDELLENVRRFVILRKERIANKGNTLVHKSVYDMPAGMAGGIHDLGLMSAKRHTMFISSGHCWAGVEQQGSVKVGLDDFAKKLIGRIDSVELPNLGMYVKAGQPLFIVKQQTHSIPFLAPLSGKIVRVNSRVNEDPEILDLTPYRNNWLCVIEADNLDLELKKMTIGKSAVAFFEKDIEHCHSFMSDLETDGGQSTGVPAQRQFHEGLLESLNENSLKKIVAEFFERPIN